LAAWASAVSEGGNEAWSAMRDNIVTSGPFGTAELSALAEAALLTGRPDLARPAAEEGIELARASGLLAYLAELVRQQAQALLMTDQAGAPRAEGLLRSALGIAREQGARWWELKAARDLARLLHADGRTGEALGLLQPVYEWFTEGHDLPDMREAKALLDELAAVAEAAPR
jgi:predicted ATPase